MKIKYTCDTCGKIYDTENEAIECEQRHIKAEEERKKADEKKKALNAKKTERQNEINELIKEFVKDYKTFPRIDFDTEYGIFLHNYFDI